MSKTILFLVAALCTQLLHAQNTKSEDVEYRYIKLPLNPLPTSIQNYQSFVVAGYEAENKRKSDEYNNEMAKAEAQYQQEMAEYPAKVKAAEDQYNAEMEEWKKKSLGEKFVEKEILKENNKPVKQVPSAPYKRYVEAPRLQTVYDYPAIASTYLVLDGYANNPANAVKVEVTLNGFDYTRPQQLTQIRKVTSSSNGTTTTRDVPYYHVEFTYRHTMSVKVIGPDGKEIMNIIPQEFNTYKTYKTTETATSQTINEEQLVKTHEEKIFRENMEFINNLVNDKIGFKRELRKTELSYVKAKDETYTDLLIAYNEASSALKTLVDDEANAKTKLQKSVDAWNKALGESDINNKKARIDKEVTMMIYFNLLETYFALRDMSGADKVITSLNSMAISNGERKQKEKYEALFADLKKRMVANHL